VRHGLAGSDYAHRDGLSSEGYGMFHVKHPLQSTAFVLRQAKNNTYRTISPLTVRQELFIDRTREAVLVRFHEHPA
jgi:hypothetical protein